MRINSLPQKNLLKLNKICKTSYKELLALVEVEDGKTFSQRNSECCRGRGVARNC